MVRIRLPMQELPKMQIPFLGREDPLEEEMTATPYSCLEDSMAHGVAKSRTRLSSFHLHT